MRVGLIITGKVAEVQKILHFLAFVNARHPETTVLDIIKANAVQRA